MRACTLLCKELRASAWWYCHPCSALLKRFRTVKGSLARRLPSSSPPLAGEGRCIPHTAPFAFFALSLRGVLSSLADLLSTDLFSFFFSFRPASILILILLLLIPSRSWELCLCSRSFLVLPRIAVAWRLEEGALLRLFFLPSTLPPFVTVSLLLHSLCRLCLRCFLALFSPLLFAQPLPLSRRSAAAHLPAPRPLLRPAVTDRRVDARSRLWLDRSRMGGDPGRTLRLLQTAISSGFRATRSVLPHRVFPLGSTLQHPSPLFLLLSLFLSSRPPTRTRTLSLSFDVCL